jgi:hypothetical protein
MAPPRKLRGRSSSVHRPRTVQVSCRIGSSGCWVLGPESKAQGGRVSRAPGGMVGWAEGRGQRAEGRGQGAEDRGQKRFGTSDFGPGTADLGQGGGSKKTQRLLAGEEGNIRDFGGLRGTLRTSRLHLVPATGSCSLCRGSSLQHPMRPGGAALYEKEAPTWQSMSKSWSWKWKSSRSELLRSSSGATRQESGPLSGR